MMKESSLFEQACEDHDKGDLAGALKKFISAAESGDVRAMERLAVFYGYGDGVELNLEKSIYWDLKAIDLGSIISLGNIAITYRARGDISEARKWFEKAVAAGDGDAALELAKMYMVSEKETDTIKKLLNVVIDSANSCESSVEEAKHILAEINPRKAHPVGRQ